MDSIFLTLKVAAIVSLPLIVKSFCAAFQDVDKTIENAARTLGSSEVGIFFRISVPLAWRGIIAGTLLAFARAMGEFGATLMIAGNLPGKTQTLPMAVYDAVQAGNDNPAGFLVVVISVVGMGILILSGIFLEKPQQRNIGYVFQNYALFPHLSVEKNIAFGLRKRWNPFLHQRDRLRIAQVLAMLEIESISKARPAELSGGQQQRVALARALVTQPGLLLLDEPFSALDRPLQEKLRRQLHDIYACLHIPVIMVTHDIRDVRELGKTVITYHEGRIKTIQTKQTRSGKPCETQKFQMETANAEPAAA